jgi:hypothetical protein
MNMPWVILKELNDMFAALQVGHNNVMMNSVQRWNLKAGVSYYEKIDELGIRDNSCWAIAFSNPFCNVGTDVHESKKGMYSIVHVLTGTQGLSVHNENT